MGKSEAIETIESIETIDAIESIDTIDAIESIDTIESIESISNYILPAPPINTKNLYVKTIPTVLASKTVGFAI